MAVRTVIRAHLSAAVYRKVGLSKREAAALVESVLAEIANALARGETVKLASFGAFSTRRKGRRIGRNPKTGEKIPILPRTVVVFRPSQILKGRIQVEQTERERARSF